MNIWLIAYCAVGLLFTTVMYLLNWNKHESFYSADIKKELEKQRTLGDKLLEIIGVSLALLALTTFWVFFLCWLTYKKIFQKNLNCDEDLRLNATKESLISIIDPEIEEKNHLFTDPLDRVPNIPFGHLHQSWINFLSSTETKDVIWSFEIKIGDMIPTWNCKDKRPSTKIIKGFASVRAGKIVHEFIVESS
jgi:hypothetical protein